MTQYDAPNQQVVRADGSAPWEEGGGGDGGDTVETSEPEATGDGTAPTAEQLDAMTKDELLATAQRLGVSPANGAMTKDEIRAGIDAKLAEG